MQVLLIKNVKGVGQKGKMLDVNRGYFRNYLAPHQLAYPLTEDLRKKAEMKVVTRKKKIDEILQNAEHIKKQFDGATLVFKRKASSKGKLYGSIAEKEVLKAIEEKFNLELQPENLHMLEHIKEIGDHSVTVILSEKVKCDLNIKVDQQEK